MQPYTKQFHELNFGKQRIGLEPSTVDKAFKAKTYQTQLHRSNHKVRSWALFFYI